MTSVSVLEAKNNLSGLLRQLEAGQEDEFVITRNGRPVAQMSAFREPQAARQLGIAAGLGLVPDDFDINEGDEEVAELFGVS